MQLIDLPPEILAGIYSFIPVAVSRSLSKDRHSRYHATYTPSPLRIKRLIMDNDTPGLNSYLVLHSPKDVPLHVRLLMTKWASESRHAGLQGLIGRWYR